jgi:hypothetical protein
MQWLDYIGGIFFMVVSSIVALFAWRSLFGGVRMLIDPSRRSVATGMMAMVGTYAESFIATGLLLVLLGVGLFALMHSSFVKFGN